MLWWSDAGLSVPSDSEGSGSADASQELPRATAGGRHRHGKVSVPYRWCTATVLLEVVMMSDNTRDRTEWSQH